MGTFGYRMLVAVILFAVGIVMHYVLNTDAALQFVVFGAGYIVIGYDVLLKAVRNIGHGQVFDENFLMVVATLGAFVIGEYPEAMAVMLFFQVGEWFEDKAVNRTRQSISALMDIQPEYANAVRDGSIEKVDPCEVSVGDIIMVMPGEKVPLDGVILEGTSSLDTKALTGESVPRDVGVGDELISGTVNLTSKLTVRVTREYDDSTVAKVLELVEDSVSRKAPAEKFITKFARYYTPAVVGAAILVAVIPILLGYAATDWVYRALTFLVVSCPCALVISVPLSYFCGIGAGSKMGILVKGGNYLEALSKVDTVVFDKTGTLTEGRFAVSKIHSVDVLEEELLEMAAKAETVSNHPISKSIREAHGVHIDATSIGSAEEIPGKGVRAEVDGYVLHVGNTKLMDEIGAESCKEEVVGTNVHVARDGKYIGHIVVSDVVKADAEDAVRQLKELGVRRTIMLSGDSQRIGDAVAGQLGLDEARCELLPADKTKNLDRIMQECPNGKTVVFVGDGINDAPSLARADIGIAMGGLGSDAAIEVADVVIMDDAPSKIPVSIRLAKRINGIVLQNIVFALGVKFIILVLAVLGIADMWVAVFGDVGVSVIAILNAMRCLNTKKYGVREAVSDTPKADAKGAA